MSVVHVAVAVIYNSLGEVLIQQRAADTHQGGLWEFPGGKLEQGETVRQALEREILEELDVSIEASRPLISITHDYGDRSVLLDVHRVSAWQGELLAREGQPLLWVKPEQLESYPMPAADRPIVTALKLPPSYVITPPHIADADKLLQQLDYLLQQGERLFLYRVKSLQGKDHDQLIKEMLSRCGQYNARLLVHEKNAGSISGPAEISGIHLTEQGLRQLDVNTIAGQLLSVSCHSQETLQMAQQAGADFAMLSPVEATASHPGEQPLGWDEFERLVMQANIPVYALGGMTVSHIEQAWSRGAQGVAGISSWWKG